MQSLQDTILTTPVLLVALTVLMILGVHWQRGLSYRQFMLLHRAKILVFSRLDPWARRHGHFLVRSKSYLGTEYVGTLPASPDDVSRTLFDAMSPHLLASAKRREVEDGHQWAHSQWVHMHDDGSQTEVFLFTSNRGGTDVFAHHETSVTDPDGHLHDEQTAGDPRGVLDGVLAV